MQWEIEQTSFDSALTVPLGNRFLIGNGYMGVRGTLDEATKKDLVAVNLAGIYDQVGDAWREPLNAPNPFHVTHSHLSDPIRSHRQGLCIASGTQYRETVYQGALVRSKRFCSMAQVHLMALQYEYIGNDEVLYEIDSDVWDINGPHFIHTNKILSDRVMEVHAFTAGNESIAVCAQVLPKDDTLLTKQGSHFCLTGNGRIAFSVIAAVYHTKDGADPLAMARQAVSEAAPLGYDGLFSAHKTVWDALWQRTAIEIEGDSEAEFALNYSMYHLMSIAPRHSDCLSIAARGLSGQTYKGAIFWDTEMFMLDFLLSAMPDSAAATLNYRIQTLDAARAKAKHYGHRGAFYAWESQEGGYDGCSDYNVTDVFTGRPMRTYFKDKQIHISAAIVHGLNAYLTRTGDDTLLINGGAEVMLECARFYHSLLYKRVESDVYELRDVIGPDEYHERVNNNAYTNEMARFCFIAAINAAKRLKSIAPDRYQALEATLAFEKELAGFKDAADKLVRQLPNQAGVIAQFDGYFSLEDTTIATLRSRLKHEKEYWGGAYGIAAETQIIKQADVITMLYLFSDQYDPAIIRANYDYYEKRTEHGSSLSACMYALAACLIGRADDAYPLFLKSCKADLVTGGKEWAGLVYIGGTHPAAAGGAYMTLLNGFLGFELFEDQFHFTPNLPSHWQSVSMPFYHRGKAYRIHATKDKVSIQQGVL